MAKIEEIFMKMDVLKKLRQLVILSVCVLLVGGGASALLLSPQIGEAISQAQNWEKRDREEEYGADYYRRGEEGWSYWDRGYKNLEEWNSTEPQFTEPSLAAKLAVGITGAACMLLSAAFWILISAWLYQSAVNSDMSGPLWLLLGLGVNVFAAALFVVIRSFIRKKCPSCGHYQKADAHWCTKCGTAMKKTCPECGADCEIRDAFCHACDSRLEESGE